MRSNPLQSPAASNTLGARFGARHLPATLDVLFQAKPPMVDALSTLSGKVTTHTDGKAYDRILVSDAISKGLNRLKLEGVVIQQHRHGKGEERRLYRDHFPVVAMLRLGR